MATKATPKFRLSLSQEQINLLHSGLELMKASGSESSQSLLFFKTLETLKAYASGEREVSYVATGEKPGRKPLPVPTAADLSDPFPTTIEEAQKLYRDYLSFYKPMLGMGVTVPANIAAAVAIWESYCTQNDYDPEKEAQQG